MGPYLLTNGRYNRQVILPEIGELGQRRLRESRVLVVGAGGLGCPALTYLAAAGVGSLFIVDPDRVEISNLHRQPLYVESDLGTPKAEAAVRALSQRNSEIRYEARVTAVDCTNVRMFVEGVDVVLDGSDNFACKYLLNDACVECDRPLVSGAVFGFEGQLSVFNALTEVGGRGPTYRCLYPEAPPLATVPSCAEAGVLGILPGIIGSLQALEVLKLLLGLGDLLSGRLLHIDARSMQFSEFKFPRTSGQHRQHGLRPPEYYAALRPACCAKKALISPQQLHERLSQGEALVLVDVRDPEEKVGFDIGGELMPCSRISDIAAKIPREKVVVLYCTSGLRSARTLAELQREFGFENLLSLEGGLSAYATQL